MKVRKVLLSLVLTLAMVFTLLPAMAFAEDGDDPEYRLAILSYDDEDGEYKETESYEASVDSEHVFKAQLYILDEYGNEQEVDEEYEVEWSTGNPDIAIVESNYEDDPIMGCVTGVGAGQVEIEAQAFIEDTYAAEATLQVTIGEGGDDSNSFEDYDSNTWPTIATPIALNEEITVDTTDADGLFKFVAPADGDYVFCSSYNGEADPEGRVLDANGENAESYAICDINTDEADYNFVVAFTASEGETYYLQAINYSGSAVFSVSVKDDDGSYIPVDPDEEDNEFEDYDSDTWPTAATPLALNEEITVDTTDADGLFIFVPEKDGMYVFSSESNTDTIGRVLNSKGDQIAFGDDDGGGRDFAIYFSAEANQVYYLQAITYYGTGVFTVSLIEDENPIQTLSYSPAEPIKLTEDVDGYRDHEGYFWYYYGAKAGDILTVDGVQYICTQVLDDEDEDSLVFINSEEESIPGDAVSFNDDQSDKNQWKVGNHTFTVAYRGKTSSEVPVTIVANPVKNISFEPSIYVYIENDEEYGWYDEDDQYFRYRSPDPYSAGNKIIVQGKEYTCNDDGSFVDSEGQALPREDTIDWQINQEGPWVAGGTGYKFILEYMGRTCEVPISIVKTNEQKEEAEAKHTAVIEAQAVQAKANAIKNNGYTTTSFTAFTKAKQALAALLANNAATSGQIKTATTALNNAIKGLKKKAANPLKVTSKNKTFKAGKLKKKKQTYKALSVTNAQGTLTYTVKPANKKAKKALSFNNKTGKITVKKKTKKGKYKITITVKAAGNGDYLASGVIKKTITVRVK